jgi:hypothetical protein
MQKAKNSQKQITHKQPKDQILWGMGKYSEQGFL